MKGTQMSKSTRKQIEEFSKKYHKKQNQILLTSPTKSNPNLPIRSLSSIVSAGEFKLLQMRHLESLTIDAISCRLGLSRSMIRSVLREVYDKIMSRGSVIIDLETE